jgi:hypothetical protein
LGFASGDGVDDGVCAGSYLTIRGRPQVQARAQRERNLRFAWKGALTPTPPSTDT